MFILFKSILLGVVCTLATAAYFDWSQFEGIEGDKETKIIFDMSLETLERGGNIKYLVGNYIAKETLKQSVMTHYQLKSESNLEATVSVCNRSFHLEYLQPFGVNSNYSSKHVCPIEPHTFYFHQVYSLEELTAPSKLAGGIYNISITYHEDNNIIGGFSGQFRCPDHQ